MQDLDTKIDQLNHREHSLPESRAIDDLDSRLASLRADVVTAQTEVTDLSRVVTRTEGEVEVVRTRAAKDQQLLDSGMISSPKQLAELQHEIASLARRQAELEDAELEAMELVEQAQQKADELVAAVEDAVGRRATLAADREVAVADITRDRNLAVSQRAQVQQDIPTDLLKLYEKLREDNGGVGAAPLRGNRCEGCHLQLPPTELEAVLSADPDDVQRCEECRRILVRT